MHRLATSACGKAVERSRGRRKRMDKGMTGGHTQQSVAHSLERSLDDSMAQFFSTSKLMAVAAAEGDKENTLLAPCSANGNSSCSFTSVDVTVNNSSCPRTKPIGSFPSHVLPSAKFQLNMYSKKVFIGGLPPDISTEEIGTQFSSFGVHKVDWPHKTQNDLFPPKGFVFLLFSREESVHRLLDACEVDDRDFYFYLSSVSMKKKRVQVRPWCLEHSDCFLREGVDLNPRKTVFVGGVPRLLKAQELARIMDSNFGFVCYAGVDVDPWMKYPKGSARVCFFDQAGYIAALRTKFVHLNTSDVNKQVEVKPFVLCNQHCDDCLVADSPITPPATATFFCPDVACLKYFCEPCWRRSHIVSKHRPIVISRGLTYTGRPLPPTAVLLEATK